MLSRGIVDYAAKELLKTNCLGCVKISPMMSLETSSRVSRKPFLFLIISLNCASHLMCRLRYRSSTHTQELNNWLNVNTGSHRPDHHEKIFFDCFKTDHCERKWCTTANMRHTWNSKYLKALVRTNLPSQTAYKFFLFILNGCLIEKEVQQLT